MFYKQETLQGKRHDEAFLTFTEKIIAYKKLAS